MTAVNVCFVCITACDFNDVDKLLIKHCYVLQLRHNYDLRS